MFQQIVENWLRVKHFALNVDGKCTKVNLKKSNIFFNKVISAKLGHEFRLLTVDKWKYWVKMINYK